MFVQARSGQAGNSLPDRVAYLRGALTPGRITDSNDAIAHLRELHRLGAARPLDTAPIVRLMHMTSDPRAERWLVRLVGRIILEHCLTLEGLDEVVTLAETYAIDEDARDALERFAGPPSTGADEPQA